MQMEEAMLLKKIKPYIRTYFERADILLLVLCTTLAVFSVFMVYRATLGMQAAGVNISPTKSVIVQILSIGIGIGAYVVFTVIDADILGNQWKLLCIINVLLLVALVIFGEEGDTGAKSWIRFAGIGVQPSEIIKVFYIIISAKQMTHLKEHTNINSFWSMVQMAGHFAIVFALIVFVSDDLGSALIIAFIFIIMLFSLGVKIYWFVIAAAAVAAVVPLMWNYFLADYQKKRLIAPYAPDLVDSSGYGITWQTNQSKLTLASGRLTGVDADHTYTSFTGKHTDFIFSTTGEQLGMLGCLFVIALLTIIIIRCVRIALKSGRVFDMLICMGVAAAITFQTFINIGMCIGITPVIGITLPFMSYGGSSMVTLYGAMGLVSGVKFKPKPQQFTLLY